MMRVCTFGVIDERCRSEDLAVISNTIYMGNDILCSKQRINKQTSGSSVTMETVFVPPQVVTYLRHIKVILWGIFLLLEP
jgi:hypothetical protein